MTLEEKMDKVLNNLLARETPAAPAPPAPCRWPHAYDHEKCDLDRKQHYWESARRETTMEERDARRHLYHRHQHQSLQLAQLAESESDMEVSDATHLG
jgi:hypothetical protein